MEKTFAGIKFVVDERVPKGTAVVAAPLAVKPGETLKDARRRQAANSVRIVNLKEP